MYILVLTALKVLFTFAACLIVVVLIFRLLKHLKNTRFPNWTFLDYVSVGYAEHLVNKYIRRK